MIPSPPADTDRFTDNQIAQLRVGFGTIQKIDPCSPTVKALRDGLAKLRPSLVEQLAGADIKWVSYFAKQALNS